MKGFVRAHCARRWSHDGWAVKVRGAPKTMDWTTSTTREEARDIKRNMKAEFGHLDGTNLDVVKVRVRVEEVTT